MGVSTEVEPTPVAPPKPRRGRPRKSAPAVGELIGKINDDDGVDPSLDVKDEYPDSTVVGTSTTKKRRTTVQSTHPSKVVKLETEVKVESNLRMGIVGPSKVDDAETKSVEALVVTVREGATGPFSDGLIQGTKGKGKSKQASGPVEEKRMAR